MRKQIKGFTLIETLLVLIIISSILFMGMRYFQQKIQQMKIDRTTLQMQQILNAGLSYYVANGRWPVTVNTSVDITATPTTNNLQNTVSGSYLPYGVTIASPWGGDHYYIYTDAEGKLFTVYTSITATTSGVAAAMSNIIAGTLPLASTTATNGTPPPTGSTPICTTGDTTCYIVASVSIPGQNLNNAAAVNFAGTYRNGACVPVPVCPRDPVSGVVMTPQIQLVPVSVSGLNEPGDNVYPIESFTAYARGPATLPANPPACSGFSTYSPPCNTGITGNPAQSYWRACLQIITEKGNVAETNPYTGNPANDYGAKVSVMAITRCSINNEPSGSNFNIYGN